MLPWQLSSKESAYQCRRCKFENGNPLHYSCPENPMDRGAWWAAVHGISKEFRHKRSVEYSLRDNLEDPF